MRRLKTVAKIRRTKEVAYTSNWDSVSRQTLSRDGNRCKQCGAAGSINNKLRAHHVIAVSRGGKTIPFNLITLCERCHSKQPGHSHLK